MQDKDVVRKEGKRKNDHKLKTPDSKNVKIHKKARHQPSAENTHKHSLKSH